MAMIVPKLKLKNNICHDYFGVVNKLKYLYILIVCIMFIMHT